MLAPMTTAVYAGTFDPPTNGHLWMIAEGARLFGELIVAIGSNPRKRAVYDLEDRLDCLRRGAAHLDNVRVDHFGNRYLVDYAAEVGAGHILRGIRGEPDFGYEQGMHNVNRDLRPEIETVFLMLPREMAECSSSLVRSLVGVDGWRQVVRRYVPEATFELLERHAAS